MIEKDKKEFKRETDKKLNCQRWKEIAGEQQRKNCGGRERGLWREKDRSREKTGERDLEREKKSDKPGRKLERKKGRGGKE